MKCPKCNTSMRCYSTRNLGDGYRKRFYRCPGCKKTISTVIREKIIA